MTPSDPPKASIMDYVMAVTGQNNDHAAKTIRILKNDNSQSKNDNSEFLTNLEKCQFKGRGQSETIVD